MLPGNTSLRDELASLRIDRDETATSNRPVWFGPLLLAAIAIALGVAAFLAYQATIGAGREVSVSYATRGVVGSPVRGTVLTGAGYVVTRDRYISIGVRVPGRIEAFLVVEGEAVSQGQVLVRLDDRQYRAGLAEASATLRLAQANRELRRKELLRLRELHGRGAAAQSRLDLAVNLLEVAEAEVERIDAQIGRLRLDLDDTVLRSPTNGVVLEKLKEVGEIATPGGFSGSGDLIRLANLDELRAEVDVNESNLSRIRLGQPARVRPDAYTDREYEASVVKLDPKINRQKGTLGVEVKIHEPDEWLRPDMSVRISFLEPLDATVGSGEGRVLIPRDAVRTDAERPYVWVVRDGLVRRQNVVMAGDVPEDRAVISAGLDGGEAIVLGEADGLREDQRVVVAK